MSLFQLKSFKMDNYGLIVTFVTLCLLNGTFSLTPNHYNNNNNNNNNNDGYAERLVYPTRPGYSTSQRHLNNQQQSCLGNRMHKLMLNQSDYVQYVEYMTTVPELRDFSSCFWINLITTQRTSTILNYVLPGEGNDNELTIQYKAQGTGESRWSIKVHNKLVVDVPTLSLKANTWHHACVSWSGTDGAWSVHQDGSIVKSGTNYQSIGTIIRGGGTVVSGQHQNTLSNGMDQNEGLEGWITLLFLDDKPINHSDSVRWITRDCRARDRGSVIGWLRTPRKGYGGVMEAPATEECAKF